MSYGHSTRTTDSSSKPVETGKEYTADITDNGSAGDDIASLIVVMYFHGDSINQFEIIVVR
jgi:predicted RNA-binding protein with TRAM domain